MFKAKSKWFVLGVLSMLLLFFVLFNSALASPGTNISKRVTCNPGWYTAISKAPIGTTGATVGKGLFNDVSDDCWGCGNCSLCDFLTFASTVSKLILSVVGGLALLMFIWGGFSFIISAGNPEKIESAKKVFLNAIIGLFIVLAAWEIVHLVIGILAGADLGGAVNIFNTKWFNVACKAK